MFDVLSIDARPGPELANARGVRMQQAHLIANVKSGRGTGSDIPAMAQRICDELDIQLAIYSGSTADQFDKQIGIAVDRAQEDGGVVIAAGGDGTLRSVAEKAAGLPVRFAAVPIGTFNFFARNHRIPDDPESALRLALTGTTRKVRLGEINGRIFLINASVGLYARSIREREASTSRFGRNRFVAIVSTMRSMLKPQRLLQVELDVDGVIKPFTTPSIFIGNNKLQLSDLAFNVAGCMNDDRLGVVLMKPVRKREIGLMLVRGITKTIDSETNIDTFCVSRMTINTFRKSHDVALDGEMFHLQSPLEVVVRPQHLTMVLPPLPISESS